MLTKRTLWLFFVLLSGISMQAFAAHDEREFEVRTHVVQPKETLYRISRQHGVSVSAIKTANNLDNDIISLGARLAIKIPKENDIFQVHIVRVSESMESVADKFELPMDILRKYNELDENVVFPGQRLFIKIDKIGTKYTYKGEEDHPITDAEAGEGQTAGNEEKPVVSGFDQADAITANATPVYSYKPESRNTPENTDSLEKTRRAFTIEGYVDAYYALFSDKNTKGALNEFAMSAPRHNQTGLNTVQLAAIYSDTNIRGNITLQYGDMPNAVYPADFKYLQQANLGFRIAGRLWFDAGFFKSPVSIEDFPNKANQSSIYSYTRYFEPVLFSGAKLGWEGKRIKLTGFVADRSFAIGQPANSNLAYGLNLKIFGGKQWLVGANGMMTQLNYSKGLRNRIYTNLFIAVNKKHVNVLAGFNYGMLQKFGGVDSNLSAAMMSATLNMQFKISKKFSLFARGEYFMDSSATVSPVMTGTDGRQQGLNAYTYGGGFEFKARPNHYLRIEARNTQLGSNYKIYNDYFNGGALTNQRWELVVTMGIWFGK